MNNIDSQHTPNIIRLKIRLSGQQFPDLTTELLYTQKFKLFSLYTPHKRISHWAEAEVTDYSPFEPNCNTDNPSNDYAA
jgi:hypothetical protein